ncbi:MAG TPA: bifunctional riboflavin kinase/FAD synthetase, partial [Myxococcales bacterium]|nr:bifunctional riboflavin kinase/FAD synthetase [Myxococcales bacterium]
RGRGGTVGDLLAAAALYKAGFTKVEPVTCDGVVVSSTKIREFIAEGRVGAAARLLGRPFDVQGRVVHGEGRGRRLGFPTANLECEGEVRPRNGVYAVRAFFGGAVYAGAANIGRKPTFGKGEVTIEIFLFDFDGDLYGTPMSVEFLKRLRGEQRFSSVEELSRQISEDCEAARAALARVEPPGRLSPRA